MIQKTNSFFNERLGEIQVYTLSNKMGVKAEITNYGGRILSLYTPDKNGVFNDIIMGYATIEDYLKKGNDAYYGAIIGRYANRIGNGTFDIDGKTYKVTANENGHCLHGGLVGFDKVVWNAKVEDDKLVLTYLSKDGEEGFPGNLNVTVTYSLNDDSELFINYHATTDKDTVCNLTNHAYFNIGNEDDCLEHVIDINSSKITTCNDQLIPYDQYQNIDQTPYSFKGGVKLKTNIHSKEYLIALCKGFDFNYCIDRKGDGLEYCASIYDQKSGRFLECFTTEKGVQLYTCNTVKGEKGKKIYNEYSAICLETQGYPNSPNCPSYPSTVLRVGEEYNSTTVYKFSVK